MKSGKIFRSGDVILSIVQFTDSNEVKMRPAVILFEEFDNIVVAGITSNINMVGIPLSKKEGAIKDSIIKLNYIFTISSTMISKTLFSLTPEKKGLLYNELVKRFSSLIKNENKTE